MKKGDVVIANFSYQDAGLYKVRVGDQCVITKVYSEEENALWRVPLDIGAGLVDFINANGVVMTDTADSFIFVSVESRTASCECGSEKVGSLKHSLWCPKQGVA